MTSTARNQRPCTGQNGARKAEIRQAVDGFSLFTWSDYAALFCGEYIGQAGTDWQAWLICAEHKAARIGGNSGDYLKGF